MPALILAAAETYQNRIESRPHRAAFSAEEAANSLRKEVHGGALDAQAVEAVLAAAGHVKTRHPQAVAGLTPREIEMLRSLARGQSMKEIARSHGIAVKTVDSHLQNIYGKIGVKTKGGAILFALEHGISSPP